MTASSRVFGNTASFIACHIFVYLSLTCRGNFQRESKLGGSSVEVEISNVLFYEGGVAKVDSSRERRNTEAGQE
jgi:hypothetical protein